MQMIRRSDEESIHIRARQCFFQRNTFKGLEVEKLSGTLALHVIHITQAAQFSAIRCQKSLHYFAPASSAANERHAEAVIGSRDAAVRKSREAGSSRKRIDCSDKMAAFHGEIIRRMFRRLEMNSEFQIGL
jgi:hypothetical protein